MKIKKNDTILVISGKYRGKKAKVISVFPKTNKITAQGINLMKKHVKPKKEGEKGQTIEVAVPFNASNAKIICPKCGKPTRITYKIKGKEKYRICKKCGQEI